jgi:hypothetical protein
MPETSIIEPPLIPTPEAIVELAVERMQATYPDWTPNRASPEWKMFLAFASIAAEVIILAFNVPEQVSFFTGQVVYQTLPFQPTRAEATSTWKALDTLGHAIEAGTEVLVTPAGGTPVAFEVKATVEIPPGSTETTAGQVKLVAIEPGTEGNVTGPAEPSVGETWIDTVTIVSAGKGGEEGETIEHYVRRIYSLAKIIKPQPILPEDFANFVRLLVPGVARCLAIDLLELEANYTNKVAAEGQERCVTVIPLTEAGESPVLSILEEAFSVLTAAREGSFKPFIGLPTFTEIEFHVVGVAAKGYSTTDVEARVVTALEELVNPATCGVPSSGDTTSWVKKSILRYQDAITAVNNVQGFAYYTTLEVNKGKVDIALPGIAPLTKPKAGHITATIAEGEE